MTSSRTSLARRLTLAISALATAWSVPAFADAPPISARDNFRIGTSGVLCSAQAMLANPQLVDMFDRSYSLSCRDAADAVGSLFVLRRNQGIEDFTGTTGRVLSCQQPARTEMEDVGTVTVFTCFDPSTKIGYRRYLLVKDGVTYLAEGLAGYDPVLRLAFASVLNDRIVPGEIKVATTEVSDAAAFARVQAGQLDAYAARNEAYLRNNSGRFAEAAEFFESIALRDGEKMLQRAEALANQGLQESNLGRFEEAQRLFNAASAAVARSDGQTQRLLRNYRALNFLNQRQPQRALDTLSEEVASVQTGTEASGLKEGFITETLADQINRENAFLRGMGANVSALTAMERGEILDAQADALQAMANRQQGNMNVAGALFDKASDRLQNVRKGRVLSLRWLQAEIAIEQALIAEAQKRSGDAGTAYDRAIGWIGEIYPDSPTLLSARARKASFLARNGDVETAFAVYSQVVEQSADVPGSGPILRDLLSPYFTLLEKRAGIESVGAMFSAAQILQRPGVAQTQAVLARSLSEGNDEAAAKFRLSLARSREIVRQQSQIARLSAVEGKLPGVESKLATLRESVAVLQQEQTQLVSELSAYPRYNILASRRIALGDLQRKLGQDEAYYKLTEVGTSIYGILVTHDSAKSVRIELSSEQLADQVQTIRESVVTTELGQIVNYPFDVESARQLYRSLFETFEAELAGKRHLIFEPDGPMLELPPALLVTADEGVAAYLERIADPEADAFDFRGIAWLGRQLDISIAVSPRSFLDIRDLPRSEASRAYLGLGDNAIPQQGPIAAVANECDWPLAMWRKPIAPDELYFAKQELDRGGSDLRIGKAFTDEALLKDETLDQYRILHFATHGLVTSPKAGCPARPALITSFGGEGSDGLLTFKEIFDLKLNADLVILSACDTAGTASAGATLDAGLATGGGYALDGLVRAFVGAGGRTVIASHWPVPDDFDATKRLIAGIIEANSDEPLAAALKQAETTLMNDPRTSHPFYWAAFVIVGDGAKVLAQSGGGQ